jgi:hypothetical protein
MKTANYRLNSGAMIALAISAAFPITAQAAAGRVEFAIGGVTATTAGGESRALSKGAEINSGDTIKTTDGRVQVRFTDGGYMSLQPNTEFVVESYNYDGKQDGSERGFFRLVEGGLRAITGIVGRTNRHAYRVATPVATIGIRGSEYLAEHRQQKLKVRVIGGSIFIENEFGDLILFKGQSGEAEEGKKPGYSEEESGVQAKGPEGGNPQQGEDESQQNRENNNLFAVNEIRDGEGFSCALDQVCSQLLTGEPIVEDPADPMTALLADYAAQSAEGYYVLDTSASGSVSGTNFQGEFASGSMTASFGTYEVDGYFNIAGSGSYSGQSITGAFDGDIAAAGGLVVTGSATNLGFTGMCYDSACTVAGLGALSGSKAETANIEFTLNDSSLGSASGSAVYKADGTEGGSGIYSSTGGCLVGDCGYFY